jgi:triacylglycerol lipase
MANSCKTKYPILMVHGAGSRDDRRHSCWGRIPQALRDAGAEVFFSRQDAWGTIEKNAETVKATALAVLSETGSEKLNVIAISKGGLETRYVISKLGMEDKIASLTTISTPHHGSKTMDFFCGKHKPLMKFISVFVNYIYRRLGDKHPDFYNTCLQFTTAHSESFNREVPDSAKVYYQSYASLMKKSYSDMIMFIPYTIVKMFDGEGDGVVSIESAKWAEFKGIITGERIRGISHPDLRDLRRVGPSGKNIVNVYIDIVSGLKEKGF